MSLDVGLQSDDTGVLNSTDNTDNKAETDRDVEADSAVQY